MSDHVVEDGWREPTRLAIAQVTAKIGDSRKSPDGLSLQMWLESAVDHTKMLDLAAGLMNLSMILTAKLAQVTGTTPEQVLQAIAANAVK